MRYPTRASEPVHRRLQVHALLCTIHFVTELHASTRGEEIIACRPLASCCSGRNWERCGLKHWIEAAARRLHYNKLAIALDKLARIAWGVLQSGGTFKMRTVNNDAPQTA